ncbi:amidase [Cryphonectria parasitica EP155]|uniref:amidase n=1 Tax=Cryphonectria parasitica (strain ATCC 38755 / EP155) TaxID=660469 RepID=A0A9P5CMU9_CRYP1|nr:amidase [Cryphonectria parasitica EP155]KAF3763265.1 amidase [Cryphonectria parasitica EP155]
MPPRVFPIVQTVPVAKGTPEYESLVDNIVLEQFANKVPKNLLLPSAIIDNPPKDVTSIPRDCGLLTADELAITETHDATSLAQAIRTGQLTSVAVTTAFAKRAIIAHQLTCCLTEWFLDEALAQARALDEHLARTGTVVGPLHGVPVSIKEHLQMAGHWSADGYLGSRRLDTEDSHIVSILRRLGAVFYCKTNQPQAIMHLETVSPYGRTLNPHNVHLSAGGSSGGEAALLALRGSVLGVGTDIGGSIRGPAGFCGVYGFKPTTRLLPMRGLNHSGGVPAELTILATCGPMAVSARDLDLWMGAVLGEKPFLKDPSLVPLPWRGLSADGGAGASSRQKPLKIGFMMNDGVIQPQPPVVRALEWARSKLSGSSDGFELKPFVPYRVADAIKNIRRAYWPDGGEGIKAAVAKTGEPMEKLTQWIIQDAEGPAYSWEDMFKMRLERDDLRTQFAEHWTEQDVDVVVCPVFVGPASAHDTALYWNYTAFWNYVDCPGFVFPTPIKALAKSEEEAQHGSSSSGTVLGDEDAHVRKLWEEGDFEGAPVCLQIVARKYHDNELFSAIAAMKDTLGIS